MMRLGPKERVKAKKKDSQKIEVLWTIAVGTQENTTYRIDASASYGTSDGATPVPSLAFSSAGISEPELRCRPPIGGMKGRKTAFGAVKDSINEHPFLPRLTP